MRTVGCSRRWLRPDGELAQADRLGGLDIDFRDAGGGRRLGFQIANEGFQTGFGAFEVDLHSFFRIQHPAIQRIRASQAINERTEAYALHYSADSNGTGASHGYELRIVNCGLDSFRIVSFQMSVLG